MYVQKLLFYVYRNSSYHHEYVAVRMEEDANSSVQSRIKDNNHTDKKNLNLTSHNNEVSTVQEEALFTCSLYISRAGGLQDQGHPVQGAIYLICSKDRNLQFVYYVSRNLIDQVASYYDLISKKLLSLPNRCQRGASLKLHAV